MLGTACKQLLAFPCVFQLKPTLVILLLEEEKSVLVQWCGASYTYKKVDCKQSRLLECCGE